MPPSLAQTLGKGKGKPPQTSLRPGIAAPVLKLRLKGFVFGEFRRSYHLTFGSKQNFILETEG